jgi:hypothetical protein
VPEVKGVFDSSTYAFAWRDGQAAARRRAEEIEKGSPVGAKILVAFGQGGVWSCRAAAPTK